MTADRPNPDTGPDGEQPDFLASLSEDERDEALDRVERMQTAAGRKQSSLDQQAAAFAVQADAARHFDGPDPYTETEEIAASARANEASSLGGCLGDPSPNDPANVRALMTQPSVLETRGEQAPSSIMQAALERIVGLGGRCTSDSLDERGDDCPHCIAEVALERASAAQAGGATLASVDGMLAEGFAPAELDDEPAKPANEEDTQDA